MAAENLPYQTFTEEERSRYLGASDVAALGCHLLLKRPVFNMTAYQIWARKVGRAAETDRDTQERFDKGHELEPYIRRRYSQITGRQVIARSSTIFDPAYDFLACNLDSETTGERPNRIVELKSVQGRFRQAAADDDLEAWGEPGSDVVPAYVAYQAQVQMGHRRLPLNDVAALVNGRGFDPLIFTVEFNRPIFLQLRDMAIEWWFRHMIPFHRHGTLVEPDRDRWDDAFEARPLSYSHSQRADARERIRVSPDGLETLAEIKLIRAQRKTLEERESALLALLHADVGDAETLLDRDGEKVASWRTQIRRGNVDEHLLVEVMARLLREVAPAHFTPSLIRSRAVALVNACRREESYSRPLLFSNPKRLPAGPKE